jgi:hypothetical protein
MKAQAPPVGAQGIGGLLLRGSKGSGTAWVLIQIIFSSREFLVGDLSKSNGWKRQVTFDSQHFLAI